ncbi:PAS domain S-box protein [Seohaeicola saemankumensis]|uniref:histidine kinase n=1 Tax=Seohaeicola saemankumensis TaxID=481181 RepID=A0ABW3T9J3_9RHOB
MLEKYAIAGIFAALSLAGFIFNLQLFNSISFVFGSIAALVALRLVGLWCGVAVLAVGASYTFFAWGHPYAMLIFTLEILIVGLFSRRYENIVLIDVAYWLFIGFPLVILAYGGALQMSFGSAAFIGLKQAVNGVFNAVFAGLIIAILPVAFTSVRAKLPKISLQTLLFQIAAFVSITSSSALVVQESRSDYQRTVDRLASAMSTAGLFTVMALENTIPIARFSDVFDRQLQDFKSDSSDAPLYSQSIAIAKVYADGAHQDLFGTTRSFGTNGTIFKDESELEQWEPAQDLAEMLRAREGRYLMRTPVSGMDDLQEIRIEFSAAPMIDILEQAGRQNLLILSIVVAFVLAVSFILIRWLVAPVSWLARFSQHLPTSVVAGRPPKLGLGESTILEYDMVAKAMTSMSDKLSRAFRSLEDLTQSLESRVTERTTQLELMSQVARQTTNGVIITDPEGRVTWVNESFTRLTGYDLEELQGKVPGAILQKVRPPDDVLDNMRTSIARRQNFHVDLLNHTKSGEPYWVEIRCNPMWNSEGEHTGFIAIENDVTESKEIQRVLKGSLDRLNLATEVAEMGVWAFNLQTGEIEWNAENFRLHGLVPEKIEKLSSAWTERVHQDDVEAITALFATFADVSENRHKFEFRLNHPERGERILSSVARVERDGPNVVEVIGVTLDVTEERRAAEMLEQAAKHTETILENVVDAIIAIDAEGLITAYNRAAEQIFGYSAAQVIGRDVSILMPHHHGVQHDRYIRRYLEGALPRVMGRLSEFEAIRANGEIFPIELAVSEIEDSKGRFFIGIVRDISERKKIERMQSEFLATVSHELRTPLTSIRGTLSLISGGVLGQLHPKGVSVLDAALKNAERLGTMIEEMLDLEKLTQGEMDIQVGSEQLDELAATAASLNLGFAQKYRISLELESHAPQTATVKVDAARTIQILTNLISNAIKFSKEGDTVRIRTDSDGKMARISVIDNGPGIPEDKQELIFQKFAQVDTSDSRKHGGMGLGLAIARELAIRMHGQVGLASEPGHGSEFWVEFPIITASPENGD